MAAPDESIVHRAVIHHCRTKTSKKNRCSTLIYQLCLVSPPVNFFAAHSGYNLSHEQRIHVEQVLQVAAGVEQCIALLFTIIYCSEPKRYWESWSRIKNSCNTSYSYSFTKLPKCYLWFQDCWADSRPRNRTAPLRSVGVHEVATTRVTRVPGPASATCPVVVCLQLMHIFSLNFTWLQLGVKDESV